MPSMNKKDEDDSSVVKVDRTSVFQEGKEALYISTQKSPKATLRKLTKYKREQHAYSTLLPSHREDVASS